jgi:hypothetical protein
VAAWLMFRSFGDGVRARGAAIRAHCCTAFYMLRCVAS